MSERINALKASEAIRTSLRRRSSVSGQEAPLGGVDAGGGDVGGGTTPPLALPNVDNSRSRSESAVTRTTRPQGSALAKPALGLNRGRRGSLLQAAAERAPTPPSSPFNSARRERTNSISLNRENSGIIKRDRTGSLVVPASSPLSSASALGEDNLPTPKGSQSSSPVVSRASSPLAQRARSGSRLAFEANRSGSRSDIRRSSKRDLRDGMRSSSRHSGVMSAPNDGGDDAAAKASDGVDGGGGGGGADVAPTPVKKPTKSRRQSRLSMKHVKPKKAANQLTSRAHKIVFSACPVCQRKVMHNSLDAHIKGCCEQSELEWARQHWTMTGDNEIAMEATGGGGSGSGDAQSIPENAIYSGQVTATDETLAPPSIYDSPEITAAMRAADPRIEVAEATAKIFDLSLTWKRHLVVDVVQLGDIPLRLKALCCFGGFNPYSRVYFGPLEVFDQDADGENPLPPLLATSSGTDQEFDTFRGHLWMDRRHERSLLVFIVLREGAFLLSDVPVGQVAINPHILREGEWSDQMVQLRSIAAAEDPEPPLVQPKLRVRLRLSPPCLDMFTFTTPFRKTFEDHDLNDLSGRLAFRVKRAGKDPRNSPLNSSGGFVLCDSKNRPLVGGEFQHANFSIVLWRVNSKALAKDGKKKPMTQEEQQNALLESLLFVIALRTTQTQLLLNVRTLEGNATSLQVKHTLEMGDGSFTVERRGEGVVARRTNDSFKLDTSTIQVAVNEDVPLLLACAEAVEYLLTRANLPILTPAEYAVLLEQAAAAAAAAQE